MAAIADLDALVNRMTGGASGTPEVIFGWKRPMVAGVPVTLVSTSLISMWTMDGFPGGAGAIPPTSAAAPTSTTLGAVPFTNPSGGREKFIIQAYHASTTSLQAIGVGVLYDRLLHISGLSGTVTTAQTVGGTLTRNTGGEGNRIYVENYVAIGSTNRTITASYTNQAGTSGRTSVSVDRGTTLGGHNIYNVRELPLQPGDTGVRSVQSVTNSASTGTAGNFGVTIGRPLMIVTGSELMGAPDSSFGLGGLSKIDADACLAWFYHYVAGTPINSMWGLSMVEA